MSEIDSEYLKRKDAKGHLKVLEVLNKWDPIGVYPGFDDEYNSYAPQLIRLLDAGGTVDHVMVWMKDIAKNHMGLSYFDKKLSQQCAQELVDFWRKMSN